VHFVPEGIFAVRHFNRRVRPLFVMLTQKGIAEGVFLSSGMTGGGIRTQDRLIDTAEIMRHKLGFKGYIHLKIMPVLNVVKWNAPCSWLIGFQLIWKLQMIRDWSFWHRISNLRRAGSSTEMDR